MKDLLAELDSYIGLQTVKEEVHNLINMASVYQLRRRSTTCPPRICPCTWCSPATPAPARP